MVFLNHCFSDLKGFQTIEFKKIDYLMKIISSDMLDINGKVELMERTEVMGYFKITWPKPRGNQLTFRSEKFKILEGRKNASSSRDRAQRRPEPRIVFKYSF